MKMTRFITLLGFILLCFQVFAQKLKPGTNVKLNDEIFTVKEYERIPNRISIINSNNRYVRNGIPKSKKGFDAPPISRKDLHFDNEKYQSIINDVFKSNRSLLRSRKETASVSTIFQKNGDLSDILHISMKKGTIITASELADLIKRLKAEIKMTFTGKEYLDHPVIIYNFSIVF